MSELNSVQLFGRVVKDAEFKKTNNVSVLTFAIAHNYRFKNEKGEIEDKANFFSLALFDAYAEKMKDYLKKGQKIIVEGALVQDRWTKDGVNHSRIKISVKTIHLIFDSKKKDVFPDFPAGGIMPVDDSTRPFSIYEMAEEMANAMVEMETNTSEEEFSEEYRNENFLGDEIY